VSTMGAFAAVEWAGRRRKLSGGVVDRFLPMLKNLRRSSDLPTNVISYINQSNSTTTTVFIHKLH